MLPIQRYLFQFLPIFFYSAIYAQNNLELTGQLQDNNTQSQINLTELIYLQTSKGIYETGEDLWFKAYILDAQHFIPSGLSKTLYLQLMNEETHQIAWQEKYEIVKRFATGRLYINDTLSEGNYLLLAFTPNSFFNDSSEFDSSRRILIKKDMKPRVSVSAEFSQLSFSSGDTIMLNILVLSEQSKPLYTEITAELVKGNEILENVKTITDKEGKATIRFRPANTNPGLKVMLKAKHTDDIENTVLPVPFHKGSPIQFSTFPEGGYLVSGLKNELAFKAVNINAEPVDIEGTLFENGDSLLRFKSVHAGMGSFEFTPDRNKKYHIKLTNTESDTLFQLPEILESGITLHLAERDSNFLVFKVKQNAGSTEKVICLRGQLRGKVYFFTSGIIKEELEIKVVQKDFPQQGIAEFTLLDSTFSPLAERLVYINSNNKLFINAKLTKEKYKTREKAVLNLKVTDENGQPVVSHLGVTVFDKIYQNNNDPQNIFTYFYLASQLKGRICDPAYYFNKDKINRDNDLDLLLQTQGWRRYIWNEQDLVENSKNRQQVIFDGVKGKVKAIKNERKTSDQNQLVLAYNPEVNDRKYPIASDSLGVFDVSPAHLQLGQGGYVYLKPSGNEEPKYKIKMQSPFDTITRVLSLKQMVYPIPGRHEQAELLSRTFVPGPNVIELGEVNVVGEKKTQFRDKFMGQLDSLAKLDLCFDYVPECGLMNCPFCRTGNKPVEGKTYNKWIGARLPEIISGIPGMHSFRYYADEIKSVTYHYPELWEEEILRINNLVRVKGYYFQREFYQPNYDKVDELDLAHDNRLTEDYRNTLLWNPSVLTNRNGEATLEFFCSDIYTGFVGIIEGVSGDGKLGSQEFEFKVIKTKSIGQDK